MRDSREKKRAIMRDQDSAFQTLKPRNSQGQRGLFFLSVKTQKSAYHDPEYAKTPFHCSSVVFLVYNKAAMLGSHKIYMKMEFSSQRKEMLLLLTTITAPLTSPAIQ